jgi:hypothetical protein
MPSATALEETLPGPIELFESRRCVNPLQTVLHFSACMQQSAEPCDGYAVGDLPY